MCSRGTASSPGKLWGAGEVTWESSSNSIRPGYARGVPDSRSEIFRLNLKRLGFKSRGVGGAMVHFSWRWLVVNEIPGSPTLDRSSKFLSFVSIFAVFLCFDAEAFAEGGASSGLKQLPVAFVPVSSHCLDDKTFTSITTKKWAQMYFGARLPAQKSTTYARIRSRYVCWKSNTLQLQLLHWRLLARQVGKESGRKSLALAKKTERVVKTPRVSENDKFKLIISYKIKNISTKALMTEGPKPLIFDNFRYASLLIRQLTSTWFPHLGEICAKCIYWSIRAMGKAGASKIMNKGHFDDEHILNV